MLRARRLVLVLAMFLFVAMGGLLARLAYLQVGTHDTALQCQTAQTTRVRQLPARRGDILDRTGLPLATSLECAQLWAHPPSILCDRVGGRWRPRPAADVARSVDGICDTLVPLLGLERDAVARTLTGSSYRRLGGPVVDPAAIEQLQAARLSRNGRRGALSRLDLHNGFERVYPLGPVAANLLGWLDAEGRGAGGLELGLEALLAGADGARRCRVDVTGREVWSASLPRVEPLDGLSVVLTIDACLQRQVEQVLLDTLQEQEAASVCAVLLEPSSGDILALASVPALDPADHAGRLGEGARVVPAQSMYPPGSSFKPLMMAAALDLGLVGPDERVDCRPERGRFGRRRVSDVHPARELLSPEQILLHSSNVGMANILTRLVPEGGPAGSPAMAPLRDRMLALGLGSRTGLPVPGEAAGTVQPLSRWTRDYTLVSASYGYEVAVTPLQMAAAVATLADGSYRPPRLVAGVRDGAGPLRCSARTPPRPVFSASHAALVRRWMESVVERGSGQPAQVPGVRVAGKTGTAVPPADRGREVHSFTALVPAQAPRLVLVLVVTDPQRARYARQSAVPAAGRILRLAVPYLGLSKDPS